MELTDYELDERYRQFLDEHYGQIDICGLKYLASIALREIDPTAYRCGFNDWLDIEIAAGMLFEHDDRYYDEDPNDELENETQSRPR